MLDFRRITDVHRTILTQLRIHVRQSRREQHSFQSTASIFCTFLLHVKVERSGSILPAQTAGQSSTTTTIIAIPYSLQLLLEKWHARRQSTPMTTHAFTTPPKQPTPLQSNQTIRHQSAPSTFTSFPSISTTYSPLSHRFKLSPIRMDEG